MTINDAGDTDSGDNDLLNFPILIGASSNGSSLVVTGFVGPGQTVDLYRADPDPSGFGEGAEYVGTFTEGGAADTDPGTGTYNVPINGLNQGTDTTNRFLATLTPAIALNPGDLLTAVATDTIASSSEFSGNVTVAGPPAQLAFLVQPSDSVVNTVITPAVQVEIQDASGARVASDATVTLTTPTDPTPGVLNGTTSVAAVGGVATFADLSLARVRSSYVLRAGSAGVVSANSNPFAVTPGPAAGALSTANVPNGTVGAPTVITVQARDSAGNARTEGGDVVVVTISGANNATATVVDNTDGTYTATYTPTASGVDQVAISLGGTALTGSPFPSTVAGGATVPGQSTANVPNGTVGTPTVITVQARDSEGNARTVGGDEVVVTVSGSNTASPTVTDNGNGTYTAQYTPASPGTDQVAITLNGGAVSGSPFTSLVMANASSGAQSTATVPDGTAGALTTIIIQARDAEGNARTVGGDTVVVMISGANSINPTVIDQGNGTYTAQYIPATAGIDEVAISLNGTSLTGSPFGSLVTTGSVSASDSSVVPNPASVVADGTTPISLLITVRDPLGNPIAGVPADAVQVFTSGIAVSITQPAAPTNAAGQTTAELRSTTPGAALATVSVGQLALDAVTATFTPRVVSGSQSSVDLSPPAIAADDTQLATLTVTLRDAAGNPVIGSPPSDRTIA
ncbi:MAG: Ig-like domain-containing protein, partial [Armatimonadetes bacterium]|nr:Ig-like domain-containing protein [Armatimonadota bacterium]